MTNEQIYNYAKEEYAEIGVDVDKALDILSKIPISLHCWQTDDVGGFEQVGDELNGGGIQVTGNYPGKARSLKEMQQDLEFVNKLVPGDHRLNLHAIYGDFSDGFPGRDKIEPTHFESWVSWAKKQNMGIDFNSTFFSHPKADDGYTLSSLDKEIRDYWIDHANQCREISNYIGSELSNRCIHNIWIPDGSKDITPNRMKHRELLKESLDNILSKKYPKENMCDAVECKLFGIGSEEFVVGSHEFYMGYAIKNDMMLCLDIGHFHPTESIADKVSSVFQYIDEMIFHVTRGVRWDSDHVTIFNDEVCNLMNEIVWADKLDKVNIGLDFFDGSINRIGAYVTGTRAVQKAVLAALLTPSKLLKEYKAKNKGFEVLAFMEEAKTKPFGAVWNHFCEQQNVPIGEKYIDEIQKYESQELSKR